MTVGAFIFDMDGVLIDNSAAYAEAWQAFLAEQDGAVQRDYAARRTFGRRNAELFPEVFRRPLGQAEIARLSQRLEAIYWQIFAPRLRPMPGLPEFLTEARARRRPCALATSAPRQNVDRVLERLGMTRVFDPILAEEDVRRGKPDPEIYQQAAARVGHPPGDCVVFEDSLAGVAAAHAAGAPCVALTTSYTREELAAAGVALVVADFADPALAAWLGWTAAAMRS